MTTEHIDETLSPEALSGATVKELAQLDAADLNEAQAQAEDKISRIQIDLESYPNGDPEWRARARRAIGHAKGLLRRIQFAQDRRHKADRRAERNAIGGVPGEISRKRVRRLQREVEYLRGAMVKLRAVQREVDPSRIPQLERDLETSLDEMFGGA